VSIGGRAAQRTNVRLAELLAAWSLALDLGRALLRYTSCTAEAHRVAEVFGDDIEANSWIVAWTKRLLQRCSLASFTARVGGTAAPGMASRHWESNLPTCASWSQAWTGLLATKRAQMWPRLCHGLEKRQRAECSQTLEYPWPRQDPLGVVRL
jgi:hypothetical protein